MSETKIGFMGAGKMASAMAGGMVEAGVVLPQNVAAFDPSSAAGEAFVKKTDGRMVETPEELAGACDVLFIAVKPYLVDTALLQLAPFVTEAHLIVSIAAGVRLARLQSGVPQGIRVIRVMPNTPCLVRRGTCGFSLGETATAEDAETVERMLAAVGLALPVEERLLDAVTGLAGSGPAFVYMMIEALSDGGVLMGLPRPLAIAMAAQMVGGAAQMVLETGEHPGALKDAVTSPGGTTIAGVQALESHGIRAAFIEAVETATRRSIELAGE